MAATTITPASAQLALVQASNDNKLALMRRDMEGLKRLASDKEAQLQQLSASLTIQTTKGRVVMGLSTATTMGAAMLGGAVDGYLTAKSSEKIGPAKITSLAGFGAALGGVLVDDVLSAELLSAAGRGLVAGPLYEAARQWGERKAVTTPGTAPANNATTAAKR
ncbi:hypothetical protein BE11_41945 [Sorangium cellulosum]|nr:hypothetical protein BE11_41945 [Sorangium cellulosum]